MDASQLTFLREYNTIVGCCPTSSGPTGPAGPAGPAGIAALGRIALVDQIYGNDSTASPSGKPYLTVEAACSTVSGQNLSNYTIFVLPGVYNLTEGITVPTNCAIRGANIQTTTLRMANVPTTTTLVTMGENSRLEDITLSLSSASNVNLVGVSFPGTTSQTAKIRTIVENVTSSATGGNTITGIQCSGVTQLGMGLSFNCVQRMTMNVSSSSISATRGFLITGACQCSVRDVNIFVTGAGSDLVAAETTNVSSLFLPRITTLYGNTADIKQTAGTIQIAPGVDLVNKTASSLPFSLSQYPNVITYTCIGDLRLGSTAGYISPGSVFVTNGQYPTTSPIYYRIQEKCVLFGMSVGMAIAPALTNSVTITVYKNNVATVFTLTISGTNTTGLYISSSLTFAIGDLLSVYVTYTGGNTNLTRDLTLQLDIY